MKIRKNDKAYLQDLKIDIHASKDINYQELALLFDKPEFLNMLPILRKEYQVVNLVPADEYQDCLDNTICGEHGFEQTKINLSKYPRLKKLKEVVPDFYDILKDETEYPVVLENECYLLCYEFNRPPHFVDVIRQSIFCNAVTESNFSPTKATIIEPSGLWFGVTLPPVAIFVSPTSTYEDIKEEFRKAKELMKTDKRLSYYQPRIDIAPNIRKYREWYWERIKGKTLKLIANEWAKKHEDQEDNTTYVEVLKGVKTYERLLTS